MLQARTGDTILYVGRAKHFAYTTPQIGEPVIIDEYYPRNKWWEDV